MKTLDAKARTAERTEIEAGACTDTGKVRENNEDSYRTAPELGLFVLSDGMGGIACGEIASRLVVDTIVAHCREAASKPSLALAGDRVAGASEISNRLASAIRLANRAVRAEAQKISIHAEMGATVVAAWIDDGRVSVAHVGDSRAYRLRRGAIEQLTLDHSFVAEQVRHGVITQKEASQSRLQNVLLRALGPEADIDVDVLEELVLEGDTFLLCSDGLTRELSDAQIAAVLKESGEAQQVARKLIEMANQAGGSDNITAIVIRCAPKQGGTFARLGKWFRDSQ